jgi:hypothetical protein
MPLDKINPIIDPNKLRNDAQRLAQLAPSPITAAAKAYVEADVNVTPGSNTYKVMEQQGKFARVDVATGEGGYALILKNVYDIWVVVAAGQDKPGKATGEKYGLPAAWFSTEY